MPAMFPQFFGFCFQSHDEAGLSLWLLCLVGVRLGLLNFHVIFFEHVI